MNPVRSLTLATLFLSLLAPATWAQRAELVDGVAAIVNNDVVTISQVRELMGPRARALKETAGGSDVGSQMDQMRLAATKDLIDRQLILQEFKKIQEKGANIPVYVIEDRIQGIIRQEFGGDRGAFIRTLQAQGYTLTKFKEIERDKIIVQAMRQAQVKDDFVISPTRIQEFYQQNRAAFSTPEQIKLRMIVLREEQGDVAVPGGKKAMAEEIRTKLQGGAEFDRMAEMYSEDADTQQSGGDWGWIERPTLSPQLSDIAFSLKPGEVGPVVQMGGSFYIMYVEAKKNASVKPMPEVRDEIERNLIQQERMKSQDRWLETLRKKAYIKILS